MFNVFFNFSAILGVTSVAYAFDKRNVIWLSGLDFLQSEGIVSGEVTSRGCGFVMQCMYTILAVFIMLMYVLLAYFQPDPKTDQSEYDYIVDTIDKPYIILEDSLLFTSKG